MNYTTKYIGFTESIQTCPDFVCTPKAFKITGLLAYKPLGKSPCQIMFDYLDNSPPIKPPIVIGFLLLGGKIAENEGLPSAYPHRGAKVLVQIDAEWTLEYSMYANDTVRWVNSLRKSLLPYAGFGYLNYCDINIPNYLYNYFGKYIVPLGSHDIDTLNGDIKVRFSKEGDTFIPLGSEEIEILEDGELIYSAGDNVRTRRWIWGQSEQGKITNESKNIFFPIDGFTDKNYESVISTRDELASLLKDIFSCNIKVGFIDKNNTEFEIGQII